MLHALGEVAREARLEAGVTQLDVATRANVSHNTISAFEGGRQARDLGRIIAAYEKELGLTRNALWERAIRRAQGR